MLQRILKNNVTKILNFIFPTFSIYFTPSKAEN